MSAGVASAQETTGSLSGRLIDSQGLAVPGATVTVTGPQGARSFVTDAGGRFQASVLTPGTYDVRAELQGFKTVSVNDVAVTLGHNTEAPIKMQVGGLTETIEVIGTSAVVDTTSTTTGAVLSNDLLQRVPVGRRVSDALYLAPGVSSGGTVGAANPSISGSSGLDNQYVVDGVNVTNTGYGALGSYSIVFGSLGNATPFDFVKEVQVKTGGYEAEYGQSMGGVVNVITKSGTNDLRGSGFDYFEPSGLQGDWKTFQSANGTVNTLATEHHDLGVEAGFPIVTNKLFFFGAINPAWNARSFVAPDGFPLVDLGEVDRDRQTLSYAAKGTYQLSPSHRFDASFFGDPSNGDLGPQRATALKGTRNAAGLVEGYSTLDRFGGHNQTVRYDGILSENWLIEGTFARAINSITEIPAVDEWRVTDRTVVPNMITGGIGFFEQGNESRNRRWSAKSTFFSGDHEIKFGGQFEDVDYAQVNSRTGPTFTAPDGRTTATGAQIDIVADPAFGQIYRVIRANFNTNRPTTQRYGALFVQDTWKVNDRLTISPGLRSEAETLVGTIDALQTTDGQSPARRPRGFIRREQRSRRQEQPSGHADTRRAECHGVPVVVNGEPVTLPAIHARGTLLDEPFDVYVLDDPEIPLVLRSTSRTAGRVVRIAFPVESAPTVLEGRLKTDGRVELDGIYFDFGKDTLRPESERVIRDAATALLRNPAWKVVIEGHTDNIGGDAFNLDLSRRRAEAVKRALIDRHRVPATMLRRRGFWRRHGREPPTTRFQGAPRTGASSSSFSRTRGPDRGDCHDQQYSMARAPACDRRGDGCVRQPRQHADAGAVVGQGPGNPHRRPGAKDPGSRGRRSAAH